MPKSVKRIIERAYKIAGLYRIDRILEGSRQQEALDILNDLLAGFADNNSKIAFYDTLSFPVIANQDQYIFAPSAGDVVSNRLMELKYVLLKTTNILYPVKVMTDKAYYTVRRSDTIQRRPRGCFLQNAVGKSILTFISKPDIDYDCEIKAKFILSEVNLTSDLSEVPAYYVNYLEYLLARELTMEYMPNNWTERHEKRFIDLEQGIINKSDYETDVILSDALSCGYYRYSDTRMGIII